MLGKEPYDPDVVAYLYGDSAEESIILLDAIEARNNPSTSLLKTSRTAKAITETLDAKYDEDIAASKDEDQQCEQAYNPCFTVTFSEPPKRKRGFVIGSDSNAADLAIKYKEKVSARQFALTFDKEHELVVEDLSSTNGTRVVYSCNNADEGKPITEVSCGGIGMLWSARGPSMMQDTPPVIIVANELRFRLVVPEHNKASREYLGRVARFMEGQSEVVAVEGLTLKTQPATVLAPPTQRASTPGRKGPLPPANGVWQKRLSSGGTSVVDYFWNVTTRKEFAIKRPKETVVGKYNPEAWKNEARVLSGLDHPNIVRLLTTEFKPFPELHFEYSPCGTLEDYISTSTTYQNKQVARQLLAALKYLDTEAKGHCLAHCNIKPANVLVHAWQRDRIQVKLCGFSIVKAVNQRQESRLGTPPYHASEIYDGDFGNADDSKGDIWSLGTLLVQLECRGLPSSSPPPGCTESFSKRVIEFAHQNNTSTEPNSLLSFVLEFMLKSDPDERLSASECFAIAEERSKGDIPPPPSSHNGATEDEDMPTITCPKAIEEPKQTIFGDRTGNSMTSRLLLPTGKTLMPGQVARFESPGPSCQQFWDVTGNICASMQRTGVLPTANLGPVSEGDIPSETGSQESLELERAEMSTPDWELVSDGETFSESGSQESVHQGRAEMSGLESAPDREPGSEINTRSKREREESAGHVPAKRPRTDESVERELFQQLDDEEARATNYNEVI